MASHGPSFRFATPRPAEQQTATASASSRLPLRNITEPDAQPSAAARRLLAPSIKPTDGSPAKLRRKNIPQSARGPVATHDGNVPLRLDAAAEPASSGLHRLPIDPPIIMKPSRRLFPPKTKEVLTCLVTPTSSVATASPPSATESPKSNILRRRPSVIGKYVSSRREESPLGGENGGVTLEPMREEARTSAAVNNERATLQSPSQKVGNHVSPIYQDANNWYPMTTPISEQSTTPSLRYTDSPSVFSHAASATPTSHTSGSPYIAHSPHFGPAAWNLPVKSSHDLRLGSSGAPYHLSSTFGSDKSNESLSFRNHQATNYIPELAHLMVDAVLPPSTDRQPPVRPSRDGTPSLGDLQTSPVIISNLPRLGSNHHRRQSSSSTPGLAPNSDNGSDKGGGSSPARPSSQPRPRNTTLDSNTLPQSQKVVPGQGVATARPSPRPSQSPKPSSRFGFLQRKDKAEPVSSQADTSKQAKKGPMAGTGHEGYGKYSAKARSSGAASVNSMNGRPTSLGNSSQNSSDRRSDGSSAKGDDAATDEFLSQRLAPVYPRGSGASSEGPTRQILRSDSGSSVGDDGLASGSSVNSPNPSNGSRSSFDPPRLARKVTTTPPSAATSVSSRAPSSRGRGSWGSVNRGPDRRASKEIGRQSPQIQPTPERSGMSQIPSAVVGGRKAVSQEEPKPKKSNWGIFSKSSSGTKQSQKWNPFQRSQSSPPREQRTQQPEDVSEAPASPRTVAHYAMPEDNQRPDFKELEDLMEEADAQHTDYQSDLDDVPTDIGRASSSMHGNSMIYAETAQILASHLELSPELYGEHAANGLATDETVSQPPEGEYAQPMDPVSEPRPSRLAQVGRIPKVVSRRDRQRKLPDQSFSRPFAESQPRPSLGSPELSALLPVVDSTPPASIAPSVQAQVAHLRANQSTSTMSKTSTQDLEQSTAASAGTSRGSGTEFLTMPLRKGSEISFSSSSGTPYFPSNVSTAVIPTAVSPVSEDEVWQEYDDLIDLVLTPVTSNGGSVRAEAPRHKDSFAPPQASNSTTEEPLDLSKTVFPKLAEMASSLRSDLSPFVGTQRRSEVLSGFEHPAVSPVEATNGFDGRGDDTYQSATKEGTDLPKTPLSHPHVETRGHERQNSRGSPSKANVGSNASAGSALPDRGSFDNADTLKLTPKSMANLRFGALMTSKWLSFGRVLFSPGHSQLGATVSDRILVIDGLGKDWSYYCALTYPNASIYSLGPEPARASNRQSLSQWQTLGNHRHFTHADVASTFPFPKNFFAVVVFRFPVATTEAKLRSALCECKRVLQPGGYLEVSTLDLDLTNMGNKARRAIRELKMMMQAAVPDVCLKLASDNIQYLVGRRGFENLKSCVVGVPAAGAIAESRSDRRDEGEMSFTELVADTSTTGDAAMTKMVAKVGRWWYMKTYETLVLPGGDVSQSIWNDTDLLRECEMNQTTFKLLVCFAQKPAMNKRRTVSL